jgi:hypothetical protein
MILQNVNDLVSKTEDLLRANRHIFISYYKKTNGNAKYQNASQSAIYTIDLGYLLRETNNTLFPLINKSNISLNYPTYRLTPSNRIKIANWGL